MRAFVFCVLAAFAVAGCGDDTTSAAPIDMSTGGGCNVPITCSDGAHAACVNGQEACVPGDMARAASD